MNIAYILHSTAINNGATKAFLNMMEGLKVYGVKPFVVMPDKEGVYHVLNKHQIPILVTNYRSSAYPYFHTPKERLLFIPKLIARMIINQNSTKVVATWIKENGIDLVHSNSGVVRIGFDAAQKVGIPHIYHIREYQDLIGINYYPTKEYFYRQLEKAGCYTICITKNIQEYYRQNNKSTSRVIYDGVFHFKPVIPEAEDKGFFLFAGRIQPAKGLDQLLKAYKLYAESTIHPLPLKVAGSNCDTAYYKEQTDFIKDNSLSGLVELLGERNDISNLMKKARTLIVSSPAEGFGFCMPEAMQQGSLVIARNTAGTKEQLDNGLEEEGEEIALRYEKAEELANLLSEVASHPAAYYQPYIKRAFRTVNKLYTVESNAKQIYHFYQFILYGTNTQDHQQ